MFEQTYVNIIIIIFCVCYSSTAAEVKDMMLIVKFRENKLTHPIGCEPITAQEMRSDG